MIPSYYSRSGFEWNFTEIIKEPCFGIRYCSNAAFWLDRNVLLLFRNGNRRSSTQNSEILSSTASRCSCTLGKYSPFNSQPSTNWRGGKILGENNINQMSTLSPQEVRHFHKTRPDGERKFRRSCTDRRQRRNRKLLGRPSGPFARNSDDGRALVP